MKKMDINNDIKNEDNDVVKESDIGKNFKLSQEIANKISTISFLEWMRSRRLRYWFWIILYLILIAILATQMKLIHLTSESIAYKYCVQLNCIEPEKGELCVFDYKKHTFVKYLIGVEGDRVKRVNEKIYINDEIVCKIPYSNNNLTPIDEMTIPKDYLFVMGTHEESFDSRYKEFGLVKVSSLKGKAVGWLKW